MRAALQHQQHTTRVRAAWQQYRHTTREQRHLTSHPTCKMHYPSVISSHSRLHPRRHGITLSHRIHDPSEAATVFAAAAAAAATQSMSAQCVAVALSAARVADHPTEQHRIQRQLEQRHYRSNKLSQQQQRSGSGARQRRSSRTSEPPRSEAVISPAAPRGPVKPGAAAFAAEAQHNAHLFTIHSGCGGQNRGAPRLGVQTHALRPRP